ncbi:Diphthine methyltransferase-like protein [Thalictrum thalictroides]|uniref:methylated diphthine methylhydrolase n=1 Tax=Thalictrum thalictroides TaxID=46969 RepID=A0A7J6US42_THATH|nr:Diphthine methyltransferase-like protein [Thalictrum thalictroides]
MDVAHCYLEGNVDAVEFCPHDSFHHVLAASTYTLQEGDHPNRSGSISLYSVDAEKGNLDLFHHVETVGIFDIKWNPTGANVVPLLAQADADGYLRIHSLVVCSGNGQQNEGDLLTEVGGENVSSSMCLCLDWNPSATSISVGLSDGSISIVTIQESQLNIQQTWVAHDFELWATAFDTHQPQLVYTGSDDCRFSCWDLRESPSTLAFQNVKTHKMGICCIAKSTADPNKLLTGSYDEYLRVWDLRSMSKPINESSICLGGGVWRIKQHPLIPDLILAACMHNGFAVVSIERDSVALMETYDKHESLAYGADWQRGGRKRPVVATCSFYDRLLRIWMPETGGNINHSG